MTTDKELLELAANAACVFVTRKELKEKLPGWKWDKDYEPLYCVETNSIFGGRIWYGSKGEIGGTERYEWKPLTDDGDALRLAVKLGMHVFCPDGEPEAVARFYPWSEANRFSEDAGNDPYAATRRAIVRAAAEIGKAMK